MICNQLEWGRWIWGWVVVRVYCGAYFTCESEVFGGRVFVDGVW